MADSGSNGVSIVAILAILVLVGLVLYFVFTPSDEPTLQLDVDIDSVGQVRPEAPYPAIAYGISGDPATAM